MDSPSSSGRSGLTRRQALQAGGGSAAAAVVFLSPWAATVARAAIGAEPPGHLLRSSYAGLADLDFQTPAGALHLEQIADLRCASSLTALAGSENAFMLVFTGPAVASGTPMHLEHPTLGEFDMFLTPCDATGRHVAVVNRVLSAQAKRRAVLARSAGPGSRAPKAARIRRAAPPPHAATRYHGPLEHLHVKPKHRGAEVAVALAPSARIRELTGWLKHDGKIVAVDTREVGRKRRATLDLDASKRVRKGVYEVALIAVDADGEQHGRNARVRVA